MEAHHQKVPRSAAALATFAAKDTIENKNTVSDDAFANERYRKDGYR